MAYDQLTENRLDGTQCGQSPTDKLAFWGGIPIPRRSSPMEATLQPFQGGVLTTYQVSFTPTASVAPNTFAEQYVTVTGVATTDFVMHVDKPTLDAGISLGGLRVSTTANYVGINFGNDTSATVTPTSNQTYTIIVATGLNVISATLTPSAVPPSSDTTTEGVMEQTFSLPGGISAAGVAILNAAGQIAGVSITNNGTGYYTPPDVVFAAGVWPVEIMSGTLDGLGGGLSRGTFAGNTYSVVGQLAQTAPPTAQYPGGSGACGIGIIDGSGHVIGVQMISPGAGYQVAPTVTFSGGQNISMGMAVQVNKNAQQAGLGISNVRVPADNQIAITYVNNTIATITPTAGETYKILGINGLSAYGNILDYGVYVSTTGVNTSTAVERDFTVTGIATTDKIIGMQKPTIAAGVVVTGQFVSTTNQIGVNFGNVSTTGSIVPAAETYDFSVFRPSPVAPCVLIPAYLTPASVAANTTAEQSFTVVGIPANSYVRAIKGSATAGLAVGQCRVSTTNNIYIGYENDTAGAIVPPAEFYMLEVFQQQGAGASTGPTVTANRVSAPCFQTLNMLIDEANDMRNTLKLTGIEQGH